MDDDVTIVLTIKDADGKLWCAAGQMSRAAISSGEPCPDWTKLPKPHIVTDMRLVLHEPMVE